MNAGQLSVRRSGHSRSGISWAVMGEEAQLSPAVSTGPPERPRQTAGRAADSMVTRIGPSVVRRSVPRRVVDTPWLALYFLFWDRRLFDKGCGMSRFFLTYSRHFVAAGCKQEMPPTG